VPAIEEATEILRSLGLPKAQQNERSALTFLALANLGPDAQWKAAKRPLLRTVDIMKFMRERYGKDYKPNSRETIRRQTLHQFEQARIADRNPDDPTRATNSGNPVYRLTEDAATVLRSYGTAGFDKKVANFIERFGSLQEAYLRRREDNKIPLKMADGSTIFLSPGIHNKLQVAVVEEFGPRFAPGANLLYVGIRQKSASFRCARAIRAQCSGHRARQTARHHSLLARAQLALSDRGRHLSWASVPQTPP
jgi:adenine-specific DNA-methyltransferase